MSPVYIFYIERRERNPTFGVVSKLINALDLQWYELLSATGYIGDKFMQSNNLSTRTIPVVSLVNAGIFERHDIVKSCKGECIEVDYQGRNIFAVKVSATLWILNL